MAKELKSIDITNMPELLRLAEEVKRTGIPYLLRAGNKDIAEIWPISSTPKRARRQGKPTAPGLEY
jgi:hypothetical protein